MRAIAVFVEGGGDSRIGKRTLREGMSRFLGEVVSRARSLRTHWHLEVYGPRTAAMKAFRTAVRDADSHCFLLVDSEGSVSGTPREHLRRRDGRAAPTGDDNQYHLMVRIMESWFLADPDALKKYYGQGFAESALPRRDNVEEVPKNEVESALAEATRNTKKGEHRKIRHGAELLMRVNPAIVRGRAEHCDRFFLALLDTLETQASAPEAM